MVLNYGQTAKAPVYLRMFGGFPILVDGGVDGIEIVEPSDTKP